MKRLRMIVLTSALLSAIAACQGDRKAAARPHVKVTGKITMNNKPVSGALVQFTPADESGEATSARTGADGSYALVSSTGPGAVPGTYKVTLSRLVGRDGKELPPDASPYTSEGKETIPPQYTTADETKIVTTVPADQETVTLDFPLQGTMR